MNRLVVAWLSLWHGILNFGKSKPPTYQDVQKVIVDEFYKTSLEFLRQAALGEYHDAMAGMLYHRRQRLERDPFNTQFFTEVDDDDFAAPPPARKPESGGGPKVH